MLQRQKKSPAAIKATDQMSAVVGDFLRDETFPVELVEFAVTEMMRVLGEAGCTSSEILSHCRKVINSDAARLRAGGASGRSAWLDTQLGSWLLGCRKRFLNAGALEDEL